MPSNQEPLPRIAPPGPLGRMLSHPSAALGLSALIFLGLVIPAMLQESCTYDEAINLASGVTYVTRRDFRMNPEHPPLPKILEALALFPCLAQEPSNEDSWKEGRAWDYAYRLLYQSGNPGGRLLFLARLPAVFWSLVLLFSVYAVARDLFGPPGALVSLGVATFCPTLLAHGHLATNDVCVTTLMFLSVVSFRKFVQIRTIPWAVTSGILLGGALGSKISAFILLAILGFGAFQTRQAPGDGATGRIAWGRNVLLGALLAAAAVVTLWGFYGFRFSVSPDSSFAFPWTPNPRGEGILRKCAGWARSLHLLPDSYLYGFRFIAEENEAGHPAFALGQYFDQGRWWYFPLAFLVKTPVGMLLLIGWGSYALLRRSERDRGAMNFLLPPIILYGVLAMGSGLNIGIRHLLPLYPFLYLLAGSIPLDRGAATLLVWPRWAAAGLLGLAALEVSTQAFEFIAFFNAPSRLLGERHEILVDSNLDWGQDLGRLKRYLDRQGMGEVKLAYFGSGSPRSLGLRHTVLPEVGSYAEYLRFEPEWRRSAEPKAGDIVAISATHFAGPYLQDHAVFIRRYGRLKPLAVIGHSILLFREPPDWR